MKKFYLTLATALFFISTYSQSGTCAGGTELTNDGEFSFTSGDTTGKGSEGGNSSPDVFYFITPGAFQTVNVGLCLTDPNFDTKLTIFSDCSLTTIIAENDDSCGLQSQLSFQSDNISTYIVMVEGSPTPDTGTVGLGPFGISVWFTAPVAQPDAAMGVSCTSGISGPTILYSEEFDDNSGGWTGDIAYSGNNNGLWEIIASGGATSSGTGPSTAFSGTTYMNYESSGLGTATASAVSPAIDLGGIIVEDVELTFYMHAYGIDMGTLNVGVGTSPSDPFVTEMIWSNQFQSVDTDPWFQVGVDLSSYIGQTIYIEFKHTGTGNGFHGDMSIDLVEVTACSAITNDDCIDAIEILAIPYNITQDASGATNNSGSISACAPGMNDGAWYTFTPLADGTGDISITNILGWDAELAIYSGSCGAFVCEANSDTNGVSGDESLLFVDVLGGVQYWINIGNASDAADMPEGSFDLTVNGSAGVLVLTVDEEEFLDEVTLYPNPANDIINIKSQIIIDEIGIYNLLGQQLRFISPQLKQTSIDIADLEVGVYIVKVKIGDAYSSYRILKK